MWDWVSLPSGLSVWLAFSLKSCLPFYFKMLGRVLLWLRAVKSWTLLLFWYFVTSVFEGWILDVREGPGAWDTHRLVADGAFCTWVLCYQHARAPRAQTCVRGHMFKQGRMVLFFCLSLVTAQLFKMGGQLLLWQQETLLGQGQR